MERCHNVPKFLLVSLVFVILSRFMCSRVLANVDVEGIPQPALKLIQEAVDGIALRSGWSMDDLRVSGIDVKDAKLGRTVIYDFDFQIGEVVLPIRVRENITSWRFLEDLRVAKQAEEIVDKRDSSEPWWLDVASAYLRPFQLAGPVDLWIQDSNNLRLALPHDVDAGILKRVLVADGAVVTVEGARELSLTRPLKLPLPFTGDSKETGLASTLIKLASRLRLASLAEGKPLLSLRVVSPRSLVAGVSSVSESRKGLEVKMLAPGAVELVSKKEESALIPGVDAPVVHANQGDGWLWPLVSLDGSNHNLVALERAIMAFLGPKAYKKGSINLLKAKASVSSFIQIQFELEKKLGENSTDQWPVWATKPSVERFQLELLAMLDGNQLIPVSLNQLEPVAAPMTYSWGALHSNYTLSKLPIQLMPVAPMTLDVDWEDLFN